MLNTHILHAISDLRFYVDYRMRELNQSNSEQGERDIDGVYFLHDAEVCTRSTYDRRHPLHRQMIVRVKKIILSMLYIRMKLVNDCLQLLKHVHFILLWTYQMTKFINIYMTLDEPLRI